MLGEPTVDVVIYARISQDRAGEGLGGKRQLADCPAEAKRRGWPVVAEFVDDDVTAAFGMGRLANSRQPEMRPAASCDSVRPAEARRPPALVRAALRAARTPGAAVVARRRGRAG